MRKSPLGIFSASEMETALMLLQANPDTSPVTELLCGLWR